MFSLNYWHGGFQSSGLKPPAVVKSSLFGLKFVNTIILHKDWEDITAKKLYQKQRQRVIFKCSPCCVYEWFNVISTSKRNHQQSVCCGWGQPEEQPVTDGAAVVQTRGEEQKYLS